MPSTWPPSGRMTGGIRRRASVSTSTLAPQIIGLRRDRSGRNAQTVADS